jgi:hypothetical protein
LQAEDALLRLQFGLLLRSAYDGLAPRSLFGEERFGGLRLDGVHFGRGASAEACQFELALLDVLAALALLCQALFRFLRCQAGELCFRSLVE